MTNARRWLLVWGLVVIAPITIAAQTVKPQSQQKDTSTVLQIYGFAQGDAIYDFLQNDPNWFDVNRPTKLPAFKDEFGFNGRTWLSARQTRFGVKATVPTSGPDLKVTFEWDLFGVGVDAGQTTIRPRLMYGQWGKLGAGQLWSPFMDVDVFPNILDYWGPNGMLFFRNVQVFWQPVNMTNGTRVTFALERPGASGDGGVFADRVELQNIIGRFPAPDISGEYRLGEKWGYVKLAAIVRWIRWDDVLNDAFDLSGGATGWGVAGSSNVNVTKNDVLRLQVVGGAGIENYFNDAPQDIGAKTNFGNPVTPLLGEALPVWSMVAFLDHNWSKKFSSSIGYSRVNIDNSNAQRPSDFRIGQYSVANLLYYPTSSIMMGGEFQWARRANFSDGFAVNDFRLEFSFKYSYSQTFGGKQ